MAELVGAFAASHGPLIAREWAALPDKARRDLETAFDEVGRRLRALAPDVLVVVSPDHWTNFFIDNYPAFCIGVGPENDGPPEPFMKAVFPHRTLRGHAKLGRHLLETALAADFDPGFSHRLTLDHGVCLPLWRMGIEPSPPIVPVFVNSIERPMPTIGRCLAFGRMLADAIRSFPDGARVAILGTGGLSHSIGERRMGMIEEPFDRLCIDLFARAPDDELESVLEERLKSAGNGGHEVRNWVVAHAAAGSRGFDLVAYHPVREVYAGCGFAEWRVAG